ncbi:hypothetical protein ABZ897_43475 [Nonomuraea sp. NPDC046802]|uniref:hypothetical protein n=1 Tax=Nonomuraea sp. NPDC046802 TaxID=3154919 RepID=UPI003411C1CB
MTRGFAAADQYRKVRRLRADYIGPWLPEPLRTEESADGSMIRMSCGSRASVSPSGWVRSSSG